MSYELKNISVSYGETRRVGEPVLRDISIRFEQGSISVILGPSGCGKTSLLNVIAGLKKVDQGELCGFDAARFSYAFQEPRLLPGLSAMDNVLFALRGSLDAQEARLRAGRFLEAAGLGEAAKLLPGQLSGGMRQRVSLARAFALPSDLLLLDEAFQSVDIQSKIDLMRVFVDLWEKERRTVILVTHNVEEAVCLADRAIVLSKRPGRIIDDFVIDTPRAHRNLGAAQTLEAQARLYKVLTRAS